MAKKFLLMFTGPNYIVKSDNTREFGTYPKYQEPYLTALVTSSGATDFVITTVSRFNFLNSSRKQILTTAMVDLSSTEANMGVAPGPTYDKQVADIRGQMKDAISTFSGPSVPSSYNLIEYVDSAVALAKEIVTILKKNNPSGRVWFGFPILLDSCYALATEYNTVYDTNVYTRIKTKMSGDWEYVGGFYYGQEHLAPWYTKFTFGTTSTVISNSFDNPIVKNMKYLANTVKNDNDGKEMLWIPFYADEDDENGDTQIGKRLGYMVNQTKIFNYVILQPSYYFIGTDESLLNVTRVKNCVLANTIYDRYGSTFAKVDNSYAQIGAEMECDSKITTGATITLKSGATKFVSPATYVNRYKKYVTAYGEFITTNPHVTAFYCGTAEDLKDGEVSRRLINFFKYGKEV